MLFSGATVVCGYHSYWMVSRMSFTPAQSVAQSLVNTVALGSIAYGTRRRNIDKRNTITQEDNLACPHWDIMNRDTCLCSVLCGLSSLKKYKVTNENWVGTRLHDWRGFFVQRKCFRDLKSLCTENPDWQIFQRLRKSCPTIFTFTEKFLSSKALRINGNIFFRHANKSLSKP